MGGGDSGLSIGEEAALERGQAFHDWEVQGRGWTVWPYPVNLEPPFQPCVVYSQDPIDRRNDSRVLTLPERVYSLLKWGVKRLRRSTPEIADSNESEPEPALVATEELVELRLTPPADFKLGPEAMARLLLSVPTLHEATVFELVGEPEAISMRLVLRRSQARATRQQLAAHLPEVVVTQAMDSLRATWEGLEDSGSLVVDFGLAAEFMRPLAQFKSHEPDPLLSMLGALADLDPGELAVFQVQFQACRQPWAREAEQALLTPGGKPFFPDAPEMLVLAKEKFAAPLFSVVLRLGIRAKRVERAWQIAQDLTRGLGQLGRLNSNSLIPLDPGPYDQDVLVEDLLLRQSRRTGMLLSARELTSLVHLPGSGVPIEKLTRISGRTRGMPSVCAGKGVRLGVNEHAGAQREVFLPPDLRMRHVHLIGASGTGKSTLMLQMALQDLEAGRGLGLIDPHGDLVDELLARMPESRHKDLVLIDPADPHYSVGFNVLSASSDLERQLLSSDLVASFKRLSTSWGDQMTSVLGNAVLAFLESSQGGTLSDLRRFLVEKPYRKRFLETVNDPEVRYFWEREFPLLSGRPQAPLLTRLDIFLRPRLVRHMVAQKKSTFDLRKIMDGRGVLLVRLSQGAIGEENAALLGALLVSKLQQAAQSRQELSPGDRVDFTLYLDEFQNYLTPSMATILSGARKYRMGLVLAHQDLSQLGKRDGAVLGAAIANPATRICFRLGDRDARSLADGFAHFDARDLQSLGVGEAVCRVEQAEQDFNLKTSPLPDLDDELADDAREVATAVSRGRHARARAEIEAELAKARGDLREQAPAAIKPPPEKAVDREVPAAVHPKNADVAPEVPEQPSTTPDEKPPPEVADVPKVVSAPGRGGQQHQYWQKLVKAAAQRHGWKATIEGRLPEGGFVDVLLEQGERRVGVEISITTGAEHELANLKKCLDAGLATVAGLYSDPDTLRGVERAVTATFSEEQRGRLLLGTPEQILGMLESLLAGAGPTETRSHGYVVKVESQEEARTPAPDEALSNLIKQFWRKPGKSEEER